MTAQCKKCCKAGMSDAGKNCMVLRPARLLCLKCLNGGGRLPFMDEEGLPEKLAILKANPQIHIMLSTSYDEMGAKTEIFFEYSIAESKRDLDVLQTLGLSPGDTRISRDLYNIINEQIKDVRSICGYEGRSTSTWPACPLSKSQYYSKGADGFTSLKSEEEMACQKKLSCAEIEKADKIIIRSHHLLCIICFIGGKDVSYDYMPLPEDNLYEVWMKMKENPDIPVTVIEGAGDCMVCTPCHGYDNKRKLCVMGNHLRDQRKDAETFRRLDMLPGDTLPAREIIKRIYENIPDLKGLCYFDRDTTRQWKTVCGGEERYLKGLKRGFFQSYGNGEKEKRERPKK